MTAASLDIFAPVERRPRVRAYIVVISTHRERSVSTENEFPISIDENRSSPFDRGGVDRERAIDHNIAAKHRGIIEVGHPVDENLARLHICIQCHHVTVFEIDGIMGRLGSNLRSESYRGQSHGLMCVGNETNPDVLGVFVE